MEQLSTDFTIQFLGVFQRVFEGELVLFS